MRKAGDRREYADLQAAAWQREALPYADAVRIEPPIGLRCLKGCK
jgi:hypothetical protein